MANTNSAHPGMMFVLDLDGVVTDPETGEVSADVLAAVAADLKRGVPVAFNTGRSLEWTLGNIWPPLAAACSPSELAGVVVSAEKGGVTGTVRDGRLEPAIDSSLAPPAAFRAAARTLVEGPEYAPSLFWDATKLTMISIERRPEVSIPEFQLARDRLVKRLESLLAEHGLVHFKLDNSIIATDIQHDTTGKDLGAEHILRWLTERSVTPDAFTAIGDSPSDAHMAETLAHAAPTTFVYVGDPKAYALPPGAPYQVIITGGGYSQDTAQYLDQH